MGHIPFSTLQAFSEKCLNATRPEDITNEFDAIVRPLGVDQWYVGSLGFIDRWQGFGFDRIPAGWRARYVEAGHARHDPVFRHAMRGGPKTTWSECRRVTLLKGDSARALRVLDEAAEFGLREGLIMPIHGFGDRPAAISFGGGDFDLDGDSQAALYLVGALAYEGLRRLVDKPKPIPPILTPQELKVLRWSAEGKSADTIGVIVNLSAFTVRDYQKELRRKYRVATIVQVVVLAALDGNLVVAGRC